MKTNSMAAAAVAGALALASMAWAEPGPGGEGGGPGHHGGGPGGPGGKAGAIFGLLDDEARAKELGLTDAQIASAKDVLRASRKEAIKLKGDVELANMEFNELMDADNPEREKVMKALDKVAAAELALQKNRVDANLKLNDIIGAETLKKIRAALQKERREQRGGPEMEHRGPPGGGGR